MNIKLTFSLLLAGCLVALHLPLVGCGGGNAPEGPELGELDRYMEEHPELMETADEEMDDIEGDEFESAEGV